MGIRPHFSLTFSSSAHCDSVRVCLNRAKSSSAPSADGADRSGMAVAPAAGSGERSPNSMSRRSPPLSLRAHAGEGEYPARQTAELQALLSPFLAKRA